MLAAPAHTCPLAPLDPLPRLTQGLLGCGGQIRCEIEDFEVEELPAYLPCGDGDHLFLWLEKRDLAAEMLRKTIARALGVAEGDIGMAGLKDRRAVTRQWVSVPRSAHAKLAQLESPRLKVIDAIAHRNKLRTGHLLGNRFAIRVRGAAANAMERLGPKMAMLQTQGAPNFYGPQRMGHGGATLAAGWALAHGMDGSVRLQLADGTGHVVNLRDRSLRRLAASALQAEVFNRTLAERMARGMFATVLDGDVCEKADTGGRFCSDDVAREQQRLDAAALHLTGPMWGPKMLRPERAALQFEEDVLAQTGLQAHHWAALGHLAEGTRRPLRVMPEDLHAEPADGGAIVRFSLPAGAFGSGVLHELLGPLPPAGPADWVRAETAANVGNAEPRAAAAETMP